jgi:formate--tetrahydrofolate ligase
MSTQPLTNLEVARQVTLRPINLEKHIENMQAFGFQPVVAINLFHRDTPEEIGTIARRLYGARSVAFDAKARADLGRARRVGADKLPVCVAKTQNSLSDDPARQGRPEGFDLTVREVRLANGAGFLVAIAGNILTMPGLPRVPAALSIDVDDEGRIKGLF